MNFAGTPTQSRALALLSEGLKAIGAMLTATLVIIITILIFSYGLIFP